MGVHKTVNGAYRYRYAPFLISTYYVMGCSPLALPLGELSPQVTERVLHLGLPSPSSLRSGTSPKERGKGVPFITPQCLSAVCSAPPICRPVFFPEKTFV